MPKKHKFCISFKTANSSIFSNHQFVHMKRLNMSDDILTIQEVATCLKLNEKTSYRLASVRVRVSGEKEIPH